MVLVDVVVVVVRLPRRWSFHVMLGRLELTGELELRYASQAMEEASHVATGQWQQWRRLEALRQAECRDVLS